MAYKVREGETYNLSSASETIILDGTAEIFTFSNDGLNDITVTLYRTITGGEKVVNEFLFKGGEQYNFNEIVYTTKGFYKIVISQSAVGNFRLWILDEVK